MKDFSKHLALSICLNAILNSKSSKRALKHSVDSALPLIVLVVTAKSSFRTSKTFSLKMRQNVDSFNLHFYPSRCSGSCTHNTTDWTVLNPQLLKRFSRLSQTGHELRHPLGRGWATPAGSGGHRGRQARGAATTRAPQGRASPKRLLNRPTRYGSAAYGRKTS